MEALSNSMRFHTVTLVYSRAPNIQWNTFHWKCHTKVLFQISFTTEMSLKFSLQISQFNPIIIFTWTNAKVSTLATALAHSPLPGFVTACYSYPSILAQFFAPQPTHLNGAGQRPLSPYLLHFIISPFFCPKERALRL